ncbi:MAG: glycoside hydrolase family 43 protein [Oscillospiraceae bacterium]|nr:glycoside hydrolase family 43 protein [Oscillospiraceae bacterium]
MNKIKDIQIRDPFIVPYENKYYLYGSTDSDIWKGSGSGFDAYVSDDLINWEGPCKVFSPPENYWGTRNFWAPEVHFYNGAFYMFASFIGDGFNRGTAVLKACEPKNPFGKFIPHSEKAITPSEHMCLDGSLYVDKKGEPWLVYCHEWVQITDGTINAVRLSRDLKTAVGEPVLLFKSSSAPWSRTVHSKSNNITGYVTDGCFMHRTKSGRLLMLWSCFTDNGYCECYAVSDNDEIDGKWEQGGVLFDENGGHGMVFTDFNGRLILTLHTPNNSPDERAVFLEIEETERGLKVRHCF